MKSKDMSSKILKYLILMPFLLLLFDFSIAQNITVPQEKIGLPATTENWNGLMTSSS